MSKIKAASALVHKFPNNFIFGTATSCYQIEGAVNEDGRGESIWDRFSHTPGKTKNGDTGDVACDHYHRADEDIALMKELGTQAYRFSIAWPRILPDGEGAVNQKGLDWYSRLVDKLLAAGIEPWATMFHWDLPQVLEEKYGGWRSRRTVEAFRRYADVIVAHLGDRVKRWMTLNEMWCIYHLSYELGQHAPGAKEPPAVVNQVQHNVLLAHGQGVRAVREHGGRGTRVGQAYNPPVSVPLYETAEHIEAATRWFVNENGPTAEAMLRGAYPAKWLAKIGADAPKIEPGDLELISSPTDFIGLNIYLGAYVRAADNAEGYQVLDFPPSYPRAHIDWLRLVPQSLYWGARYMHDIYGCRQIYITENGSSMNDQVAGGEVLDTDRVLYYREYLKETARLVAEKYPVKGYFAWTLMDNFEWAEGYTQRFGLYYVDFKTQQRTAKLSAKYYAACIKARQVL